MTRTAAVLLLALGVSADVPAWVQKKSSLNMPSIESIMAPVLSLQNRVNQQTSNSRRLQAIMSTECNTACPGVKDMIKAMMEMATQTTTPVPAGMDPTVAMLMGLCDYADAIVCAGTTDACQDPGPKSEDDPAAMKCLCACPKLATMGSDPKAMCSNKADTFGCATSQSSCDSLVKGMGGAAAADVQCKMIDAGCQEKMEKMGTCEGMTAWNAAGCDQLNKDGNLASKKDTCCPAATKLVACMTKECMDLQMAATQLMADTGSSEASKSMSDSFEIGKLCTDSGMPSSKADVQATIDTASGSGGSASDFAAPSQAAPVLAMAAAMVAFVA